MGRGHTVEKQLYDLICQSKRNYILSFSSQALFLEPHERKPQIIMGLPEHPSLTLLQDILVISIALPLIKFP